MDSIINGIGGGNVPVIGSINGKITWSTGSATLTLTTDVEGVTIQYRKIVKVIGQIIRVQYQVYYMEIKYMQEE